MREVREIVRRALRPIYFCLRCCDVLILLLEGYPRNDDNRKGWESIMVEKVNMVSRLPWAFLAQRLAGSRQSSIMQRSPVAGVRASFRVSPRSADCPHH